MSVLYLTEQGSVVRKDHLLFTVVREGETFHKVPLEQVNQIVVFGNVGLTTPVLHYLLRQGIDCVFCTVTGDYYGRLVGDDSNFGALRLLQYSTYLDPVKRLEIARAMVRGKLTNQRTLMQRYRRVREDARLDNGINATEQVLERLERASETDTLMGMEGAAAVAYFAAMRALLKNDLGFVRRARRPPPDPVNAMLSLGYTLLTNAIGSAVRTAGLDVMIGYLHAPAFSRPSLALDLMEEFRPIIVDSVVLRMVNTGMIEAGDFVVEDDAQGRRRVTMSQPLLKRFLAEFEKRVQTVILHPDLKKRYSYRQVFELQARQMAQVVRGERRQYTPFLVK